MFSREYNDSDYSFKEGDQERAPNYVVTPSGAKINRLFVVGVLTEVENIGDADDLYRARISDPLGVFTIYAGQYQRDAMQFLEEANPPLFLAVVGKARTYTPDDGDEVYTSIRPEEINEVDELTRDLWNIQTAQQTLKRLSRVRNHISNGDTAETGDLYSLDETLAHYGYTNDYYEELRSDVEDVLTDYAEIDEDDLDESSPEIDASEFEDIEQEEVMDDEIPEPEWDMSDETREEVEEEYGAEFESADEITEDEEQEDMDEAEETREEEDDVEDEIDVTDDSEEEEGTEEEGDEELEEQEDDDLDISDEVLEIIEDKEEDGVARNEILDLAEEKGIDRDDAEDALEDLLMNGLCYPTDNDLIKPL